MYNDLEEYSLTEVTEQYLLLEKTYVDRIEDWTDPEQWRRKAVKVPNPLQGIHD